MVKPKIGLTFSGGGYRSATFDLGVLSFLNSVTLEEGGTLLDCVVALSSVSGGTIPAMRYMLARAERQPVNEMISELYGFLCENDLVSQALGRMSDEKANPNVSLIRIMADIYDEYLFHHNDLGVIMDNFDHIPVKDYTALATDFDTALPFRFRVAEYIRDKRGIRQPFYEFGNAKHRIKIEYSRLITMGEALACSSCFPSCFEPMMFPEDFKLSEHKNISEVLSKAVTDEDDNENKNKEKKNKQLHGFGIMDGGVADNEGIESILNAEERMRNHRAEIKLAQSDGSEAEDGGFDDTDKALDVVIISDVSSPYIDEGYTPHKQCLWKWLGDQTIGRMRNYGLVLTFILLACLALALFKGSSLWTVVTTALLAIVSSLLCGGAWLKKKIHNMIAETFIGDRARFISHMKFATCESLLMNRAMSVVKMSSEVFLKRQRQMNYKRIHGDPEWQNRRISNLVYELRAGENWSSDTKMDPALKPKEKIQENSAKAASMGTTLWFTDEDKKNGIPRALFAAGQYTMCYNLLDYIDKIQRLPGNLTAAHNTIIALKPRLMQEWEAFQNDPLRMAPEK